MSQQHARAGPGLAGHRCCQFGQAYGLGLHLGYGWKGNLCAYSESSEEGSLLSSHIVMLRRFGP